MGPYIEDIVSELATEFAVDGVEINYKKKSDRFTKMTIKYIDEEGVLNIRRRNKDVVFSYEIERERKEIKKGLMGAVSGAGLGSLVRGALRGSSNLGDQVAGAVGGAVAGGAYKAYEGYEESGYNEGNWYHTLRIEPFSTPLDETACPRISILNHFTNRTIH